MREHEHEHHHEVRADPAPPTRAVRAAAARLADRRDAPAMRLPRADEPLRRLGTGRPLSTPLRTDLEQQFATELSSVRVHTDDFGARAASAYGADAVTSGASIAFAASTWRPDTSSGRALLAHEVAHVVQQRQGHVPTGRTADGLLALGQHGDAAEQAADRGGPVRSTGTSSSAPSTAGPTVAQFHSSHEHRMLGDLTPEQVKALANGKAAVGAGTPPALHASMTRKERKKQLKKRQKYEADHGVGTSDSAAVREALHIVEEQLEALDHWRTGTPALSLVSATSTKYNVFWGGQLVVVPSKDGTPVVATVGDLNALPDYFGAFEDATSVSYEVLNRTFQVIRRETYVALKKMHAALTGQQYEYDHEREDFGVATKIGVRGGFAALDDFKDMRANADLTKGRVSPKAKPKDPGARFDKQPGGVEKGLANKSALGRNACHFPPESWLRWRDHHNKARLLITNATTADELGQVAQKAVAMNAFGEHYLQDSFAGGHLINKGYVMAYMQTKMSSLSKYHRGITPELEKLFLEATAHRDAYKAPQLARTTVEGRATRTDTRAEQRELAAMKGRDPQAALDAALAATMPANKALPTGVTKKDAERQARARKEVQAAGLDPDKVTFEQYRRWLNDTWFQMMTNILHNRFCEQGLVVGSPDKPNIGRVYGDKNMLESAEGAEYTAETSRLSRTAINQLIEARTALIDGRPQDAPNGIPSMEDVFSRFPDRVHDQGTMTKLVDWATGRPVHDMIDDVLRNTHLGISMDGVKSGGIRLISPKKKVAGGLKPEHSPF